MLLVVIAAAFVLTFGGKAAELAIFERKSWLTREL